MKSPCRRYGSKEESDSLHNTRRRLIQSSGGAYEHVDEARVESQASEFRYRVEHLFLRLIREHEGAIVGFRDSDSVVDLPR